MTWSDSKTVKGVRPAALLAAFLMGICLVLAGCGEKGPPLPPVEASVRVAAPEKLKAKAERGLIYLTWQLPAKAGAPAPDSVIVYVARKGPADCTHCPFKFTRTGIVSLPETGFVYSDRPGYNYYFRVQAQDREGNVSEYSQTVKVKLD